MDKENCNVVGLELFMEGCKALGYEDEEEASRFGLLPKSLRSGSSSSTCCCAGVAGASPWRTSTSSRAGRRRSGRRRSASALASGG